MLARLVHFIAQSQCQDMGCVERCPHKWSQPGDRGAAVGVAEVAYPSQSNPPAPPQRASQPAALAECARICYYPVAGVSTDLKSPTFADRKLPSLRVFRCRMPARRGPTMRTTGVSERASSTRRSTNRLNIPSPSPDNWNQPYRLIGIQETANWKTKDRDLAGAGRGRPSTALSFGLIA